MTSVLRAALLLLVLVGCTEPRSQTCRAVCAREAQCREPENPDNFDEGECLDACAALERDQASVEAVAKHAECVLAPGKTCDAILKCD
jgi:hypothetical protein